MWLFSSRSESTNREVSSLLGLLKTVASHFRVEPVRIPLVMSVREIQRRDQTGTRKWPVVSLQITLSMAQLTALSGSPQNHSLPPDPPWHPSPAPAAEPGSASRSPPAETMFALDRPRCPVVA